MYFWSKKSPCDLSISTTKVYENFHTHPYSGETEENRLGIIQGQADTLLNETGKEQARKVGERLACESFTQIFSSDLCRAKDVSTLNYVHLSCKQVTSLHALNTKKNCAG